jgi:4-hydroxythreonine-4-phosphate dehydrogenase
MSKVRAGKREFLPAIAVTLGDPAGIGPEVVVRALADRTLRSRANWLLVGPETSLRRATAQIGANIPYTVAHKVLPEGVPQGGVVLLDPRLPAPVPEPGKPDEGSGKWSSAAIEAAVDLTLSGIATALVTAPISKLRLMAAGREHPGHTEMLAALCGVKKPIMLLASGDLKVALFTRHIALRAVFAHMKRKALVEMLVNLDSEFLRWFGSRPKIGVLGLNPHGGEGGLFGTEEIKAIAPAIEDAKKKGIAATGPIPADTAFCPDVRACFDVLLAMYHDQGLGPFKALAFSTGVNITLGLPFIRTSPDHGTAYNIANKWAADHTSMTEAMSLAIDLADRQDN